MRKSKLALLAASVVVLAAPLTRAAVPLPIAMTLVGHIEGAGTSITSTLTIRVDRMMLEMNRTKVTDALKFGGYPNFLSTLRTQGPIGSIETQMQKIDIRYAHEEQEGAVQRLVLVADQPLVFLNPDKTKSRAGYELTVVELRIDAEGGVTGSMAGAARVKPSGTGTVILDNFQDSPIVLKGNVTGR